MTSLTKQFVSFLSGSAVKNLPAEAALWLPLLSREAPGASLEVQLVKNPPAMQETMVQFLGRQVPLEMG